MNSFVEMKQSLSRDVIHISALDEVYSLWWKIFLCSLLQENLFMFFIVFYYLLKFLLIKNENSLA